MRYFVAGTIWAFLGRAGAAAFALMNAALVARLLSPDYVGLFFVLQSAAFFGALFLRIGLDAGIARFVPPALASNDQDLASQYIFSALTGMIALWMLALTGCSLFFESISGLFGLPSDESHVVVLAIVWAGLVAFQHNLAAIHQARHDLFRASLYRLFLGSAILFFALLYLTTWEISVRLSAVLSAVLFSIGVSVLLSFADVVRLFPMPSLRGLRGRFRAIYCYSHVLVLYQLSAFLLMSIDLWIVAGLLGQRSAGIYAVASRFVILMSVIVELTNAVVLPELGRLLAEKKAEEFERLAKTSATLGVVAAIPVMMVIVLAGEALLGSLFGAHFRDGSTVLIVLAFAQLIVISSGVCEAVLIVTGRTADLVSIAVLALLVGLVLIPLLGLWKGIEGSALGVLITIALQRVLLTARIKRTVGISTMVDGRLLVEWVRSWRR